MLSIRIRPELILSQIFSAIIPSTFPEKANPFFTGMRFMFVLFSDAGDKAIDVSEKLLQG